ncbi:Reticulocyte-binding protein 2-like protein a [Verticillium dahliae VDG2]|nr:Reticulocyte-binding protein 2-like protein a [Verticillium dahliae VDG2]
MSPIDDATGHRCHGPPMPRAGTKPGKNIYIKLLTTRRPRRSLVWWNNNLRSPPRDCNLAYGHSTPALHCRGVAGHVKFDSELSDALACNVDGVLHLLELARRCPKLRQVVVTSTAYVSPPVSAPVVAELVPLPHPAQALYRALKEGKLAKDEALRLTGHPNVYALSKSLAEHLVFEHRRGLPVTIVRPSIISAALQHPEPGWIDSKVAFAALVLCFEKGILKVIDGDGDAKLDIMPVDEVARCLIREAFQDGPSDSTGEANRRTDKTGKSDQSNCPPPAVHSQARITFSTATVRHSLSINEICLVLQRFFSSKYPTQPRRIRFVGHGCLFKAYDALYHSIPLSLHSAMWRVLGRPDVGKRSSKALHIVKAMNAAFRYYTRQTYDFQAGEPSTHLDPEKYLEIRWAEVDSGGQSAEQ